MIRKKLWVVAALVMLLSGSFLPMFNAGAQEVGSPAVETTATSSSEQVVTSEVQPPEQETEPSQPRVEEAPAVQSEEQPQANAPPQATGQSQPSAETTAKVAVETVAAPIAEDVTGKIVIRLYDEENPQVQLGNGVFRLVDESGKYYSIKWTDLNRDLVYDNLPSGKYRLEQTDAPNGYLLSGFSVAFEIKAGATYFEYTVTNKRDTSTTSMGEIHVTSVDEADPSKRLAGACYEVIHRATGEVFLAKTEPTDRNGELVIKNVPAGDYSICKNGSPEGYTGPTARISFSLTEKNIAEKDFPAFTFTYTKRTEKGWVTIECFGEENDYIVGAEFTLYDANGNELARKVTDQNVSHLMFDELEPGHRYTLKQTKAPDGYEESTEEKPLFEETFDLTYQELSRQFKVYNKKRPAEAAGTLTIKKYEEGDETVTIGDAEFTLYHTDGNTLATKTTKAGQELVFDKLPKGTYRIKETKAPDGYQRPIFVEEFTLTQEKASVEYTVFNKKVAVIKPIATTGKARDKSTGGNEGYAQNGSTIIEEVRYQNLEVGKEYTIKTVLMDPTTNQPLLINGKEVRVEKKFTAKKPDGRIDVDISFDGSSLAGKSVVVVESLYQAEKEVANDSTIANPEQTITYPAIATKAAGQLMGDNVQIKDTITYKNLVVGQKYTVKGQLMEQVTGLPYQVNGKKVVSEASFTAEKSNGTVEVTFAFAKSALTKATTLVVFEQLFNGKGSLVADHQELTDANQMVKLDGTTPVDKPVNTPTETPKETPKETPIPAPAVPEPVQPSDSTVSGKVIWRYSWYRGTTQSVKAVKTAPAKQVKALPKTGSRQNTLWIVAGFLLIACGVVIASRRIKLTK